MKNKIIPIIFIFSLLILGCNYEKISENLTKSTSDKPAGAMESYMKNACQGKIDEASESFSQKLRQTGEILREGLKIFETVCKEKGGFKQLDVPGMKTKNDSEASVRADITFKNGDEISVEHQLIRENGEWKVVNPFRR